MRLPGGRPGSRVPQRAGPGCRRWPGRGGRSGTGEGLRMVSETRASEPSERNVLEDLDSRIPTSFYWYLAVLACVGGFLFGYDTSNIGSALAFIPYHLSSFATGYLVAGASLGAAAGALIA